MDYAKNEVSCSTKVIQGNSAEDQARKQEQENDKA